MGVPEAAYEARRVAQVQADIDALGDMIERLLQSPRVVEDSVALMAARSVLEQRRAELARILESIQAAVLTENDGATTSTTLLTSPAR